MGSKKIKRRVTLNVCVGGKITWLTMKILDLLRSITRRIRKSLKWNLKKQIGILNVYKNGHNHAEITRCMRCLIGVSWTSNLESPKSQTTDPPPPACPRSDPHPLLGIRVADRSPPTHTHNLLVPSGEHNDRFICFCRSLCVQ